MNLRRPGAAPAFASLLKLTGWSKEDLALAGAHLCITTTSRSYQWEALDPGPAVWPPGYRLLLRWGTKDALEDKAPQPIVAVVAGQNAAVSCLYWSVKMMEVEDGLAPKRTKADATRWGYRVAWDDLQEVV